MLCVSPASGLAKAGKGAPRWSAPVAPEPQVHLLRTPFKKLPFIFLFHPSLRLAPSLSSPNKQAFLVLDNEACFLLSCSSYHFRTFSIAAITLLMSSFALLRVSARTDLPDIAAVGIIFLKLAGSSDTMQTVERTEEPMRLRGLLEQRGEENERGLPAAAAH